MNPYLNARGIRFNDHMFTDPVRIGEWTQPKYAGVFAILIQDSNWAPKPFQALYFGEFGNNVSAEVFSIDSMRSGLHRAEQWIAVLPMPFSTTAQRTEVCRQLTWAYNPVWQGKNILAGPAELARKLEELEKRNEEQTTQLRLLLATINKLFEPQPERPRRQIGFLVQPVTAV